MAGPRILFIWELGDGLGHVSRMLPLARQLQGAGATCVFAVRNVENSHKILGDTGMALLQAPITHPVTDYTGKAAIGSYGDIMETVGYGRVDRLYPLLCAWDGLYQTVEPDLIVADYAPTALLAARGQTPAVAIGDWFTLPPSTLDAFPNLRDSGPRIPESDLLAIVRDSQQRRNAPAPATLPGILDCAASAIITLPELDFYAHLRQRPPVGPLLPLPAPLESRRREVDYFAYLSLGFRSTGKVLEALVSMPVQGSVYLRDGSARERDEWRDKGLTIHDTPQDMREMGANSAVIIHHGGLGTIETVLALGRPQMLVPRHLEQGVNARMAGRLQLAVGMQAGGKFEAEHIVQALRHALDSTELHDNAARKASELAERGPFNALESMAEFCLTTLDEGINPKGATR
jgi:UDP:flavonoid glycosyltransferase YjiC (YdhE family)